MRRNERKGKRESNGNEQERGKMKARERKNGDGGKSREKGRLKVNMEV